MATKYVTKAAWGFQYVVDDAKPFYRALVAQGVTESVTPYASKPIFPGSSDTASSQPPLY